MARHASGAESDPLNLSGAMTTFMFRAGELRPALTQ
jgi:hypothetical protein